MSTKIQIALLQHAASMSEPRDSILKRVDQMAREATEERLIGECDFARVQELRRGWAFHGDCGLDTYARLTQRILYGAE
jgi:hypothetical protein